MQYILSEEEYKQLIPKSEIVAPLKKFKDSFSKTVEAHYQRLSDHPDWSAQKVMLSEMVESLRAFEKELKL